MKPRSFLFASIFAATLAFSGLVHAMDARMVAGPIERVDSQGRIHVSGQTLVIDADTQILDQHNRQATQGELSQGVRVEVTFVNGRKGATATTIIATLLR
jgi:hypothetical protein